MKGVCVVMQFLQGSPCCVHANMHRFRGGFLPQPSCCAQAFTRGELAVRLFPLPCLGTSQ